MKTALDNLAWSVRALSHPAEVQKKLFPSIVVVADELALTFDEYYGRALSQVGDRWSAEQLGSLRTLAEKLSSMSGPNKEELWLADDCLSHPEWSVVRTLAKEALIAFDWSTDQPPPSDAIYVSGKKNA
jgi:hypothetical protein